MKIEKRTVGSVDVCAPTDALVEDAAVHFGECLHSFVKRANPRVVVDMQEVGYMDSVALEAILDAVDELSNRSCTLKLATVSQTCREVLELTGLSSRVQIFEDVGAAVRSFM